MELAHSANSNYTTNPRVERNCRFTMKSIGSRRLADSKTMHSRAKGYTFSREEKERKTCKKTLLRVVKTGPGRDFFAAAVG